MGCRWDGELCDTFRWKCSLSCLGGRLSTSFVESISSLGWMSGSSFGVEMRRFSVLLLGIVYHGLWGVQVQVWDNISVLDQVVDSCWSSQLFMVFLYNAVQKLEYQASI